MKHTVSLFAVTAFVLSGLTIATIDAAEARTSAMEADHTTTVAANDKTGMKLAKRKMKKKKRNTTGATQFQSNTTTPPPTGPGKLAAEPRVLEDVYCGPGHVPCDDIFIAYCKVIGGTMSKKQPWGGKTCFHPTEW